MLKHVRGKTNEKSKDVTTLDWNVSSVAYYDLNLRQLLSFLLFIYFNTKAVSLVSLL